MARQTKFGRKIISVLPEVIYGKETNLCDPHFDRFDFMREKCITVDPL
jgi:hypothetical protein